MTQIPWSPKQNIHENVLPLGFYALFGIFPVALFASDGGPTAVASWLALHLALTAGLALFIFRAQRSRYRRRWTPTHANPPDHNDPVVLEGRIGTTSRRLISPFTGASCVAWGLVEREHSGDGPRNKLRWIIHPFVLEDPRGRWRARVYLGSEGMGEIPDVSVGVYLGGETCSQETRSAIEKAAAAAIEDVHFDRVSDPRYGLELHEGDRIVIRARWTSRSAPAGADGVATYDLQGWNLECGTAEAVASRHGYHWYATWGFAIFLSSIAATVTLGLSAWFLSDGG